MEKEIKDLLAEQAQTFEAFKAANDLLQKQVKELGAADAVTAEKVEKINKALDEVGDRLGKASKRTDEIEAKLNRPGALVHGDAAVKEMEMLSAFNLTCRLHAQLKGQPAPADLTVEDFREYKKGFTEYLRRGDNSKFITEAQAKAMRVGVEPDGGYLVLPDMSGRIVTRMFETSPIRQIASLLSISTDAIEGINDIDEAEAEWTGEETTRNETDTPTVGKWRIPVHEMAAKPKATQQLLDDAMFDIEAWLGRKVADKMARKENAAFVTGNGVAKPKGFMAYAAASVTTADATRAWGVLQHVVTGAAAGFPTPTAGESDDYDSLITLIYELKPEFRQNARWVMARRSIAVVRKLKDANGNYFWRPGTGAGPSTLLEYPITEAEDMPAFGAGLFPIAFGDFREGYQIVDRQGIRVLRDPYTAKPYVKFYTTRRVGGDVLNSEAIKLLKCSA